MAKKKYLPLYYKWSKTGTMTCDGLCAMFMNDPFFKIIDPEYGAMNYFWGFDGELSNHFHIVDDALFNSFTPLRQNVLLLMAAMAGEL